MDTLLVGVIIFCILCVVCCLSIGTNVYKDVKANMLPLFDCAEKNPECAKCLYDFKEDDFTKLATECTPHCSACEKELKTLVATRKERASA